MTDDSQRPLYYDMQALLAGELPPPPQPAIGCRDDGHHIFYAEQVNLVFGDPETGKTWLCLWCGASKLINDPTSKVAVIDMDHNGPTATATRLLAFGVPKEVLSDPDRFRYVEPDDRLHMAQVIADLAEWRPAVVIVDSLGELMPLYGANSYSGDDFTDVNARVLKPLAKAGAAVLVIDHLSKGADSRNFGPVGTAAKRRAIGGVSLRVTIKDAFTPGSGGAAYLKVNKDRHGGLREHCPTGDREPLAGTFTMRVFHDALTGEIKAADGTETVNDDHALSASQARDVAADVALLDALDPPPSSVRDVCQRMGWSARRGTPAINAWRESKGQPAPKNQHEGTPGQAPGELESAVTGNGTPYVSVTAVTAPLNNTQIGIELALQPESAVTQDDGATATVAALDSRRPHEPGRPTIACREWLHQHILDLLKGGTTQTTAFAIKAAGQAAGYSEASVGQAIHKHPGIKTITRKGGTVVYSIDGTDSEYMPVTEWVHTYLDGVDADTVDKDDYKQAAATRGYSWDSARTAIRNCGRITSEPAPDRPGHHTIWRITESDEEAGA